MKYEKNLILKINPTVFTQLVECVKNATPHEACGILFGEIKEIKISEGYQYQYIAEKFKCYKSDKESPVAFLIENIEELALLIEDALQEKNMRVISIFHSHPAGASPSSVDINNMMYLNEFSKKPQNFISKAFNNLIWSIMDAQNKKLNGFIYLQKELIKINIRLEE